MRRRSAENLGESAGDTGSVNEGQADGGPAGESVLAASPTGYAGAGGEAGSGSAMPTSLPGTGRPSAAPPRRPASSAQSRFTLSNWRVRWRLVAVIAVPTLTAAILGSLQIYGDVSHWSAAGRVQHLAQLNSAVVQLTQALEDERDLSAGYASAFPDRTGGAGAGSAQANSLARGQKTTTAAVNAVDALATGVNTAAGYQTTTVQDLTTLTDSLRDLGDLRHVVTTSKVPEFKVIQAYTENIISANTFSGATGAGANDAELQGDVTTLGALLRIENETSVQRAVLYAVLSSPTGTAGPGDLTSLNQAFELQVAGQSDFDAAAGTPEQQVLSNTVSGLRVDHARSEEDLAQSTLAANPNASLTAHNTLNAATWYTNMSATIGDTRQVANQLAGTVTTRANALRSKATQTLLVTSLVTLVLLLLVLLVSTFVARSLIRPLRKLRSDALDVAGHRLPEMVRRLSQSE
ncbi:MAG: nitrate- and nitrite sensing domain-containing protein, partial [Streptosporangiaceae bacterium]